MSEQEKTRTNHGGQEEWQKPFPAMWWVYSAGLVLSVVLFLPTFLITHHVLIRFAHPTLAGGGAVIAMVIVLSIGGVCAGLADAINPEVDNDE